MPTHICVLDLETSGKKPEVCELYCAGVLPYRRHGIVWKRGSYLWYGIDQVSELLSSLIEFPGLIIGHNIFDFDYRVLAKYGAVEKLIERTVDLRLLVHSIDRHHRARQSLDSLARLNIRRRKTESAGQIPALWRRGERKKVLVYNRKDCELTAELWMQMIRQRKIRTKLSFGRFPENGFEFKLDRKAMKILNGKNSQLTVSEWQRRLDEWGNAVRPPNFNAKFFLEEPDAEPDSIFHKIHCYKCDRQFIWVTARQHQFKSREFVKCLFCSTRLEINELSTLINGGDAKFLFVTRPNFLREGSRILGFPRESVPNSDEARKWINRLRIWKF